MASSLPTELHEVIFQHLKNRDLSTLCTVSRRVRIEAERLLYRDLSLPQIKDLKAWCFVVTRRPEIALHIRSLSITMPSIVGFCLSDLPGFTQNLKLCTNLRELEMHGSGDYSFLSSHTFHPWLLEGASFRLTKFVNTYFAASSLLGFLASQPDISILTLPSPSESITLPNTILPNLRVVDLDWDTFKLIENPRKIEHARINLSWLFGNVQADVFWPLRSFPCLRSVTVKKRQAHYISMAVIVTFIAEALPELKDFTIVDDDIFKAPASLNALTKFRHLEYLTIQPSLDARHVVSLPPGKARGIYEPLARPIVAACSPSLRRLIIGLPPLECVGFNIKADSRDLEYEGIVNLEEENWSRGRV